jgi:AraC-like DNA-binding protein
MSELLIDYPRVRSGDLDEARARVGEVFCPHRLEPLERPAQREIRFNSVQWGALRLSYLTYGFTVRIRPQHLQTFILVQIPLAGRGLVRTGAAEIPSDTRIASVPDPDADLDMCWEKETEQLIVRVDRAALETQVQRLLGRPLAKRLRMSTAMDLTTPAARSWLATVQMLRADLEGPSGLQHPILQAQAERLVMSQLLTSLPNSAMEALHTAPSPATPRAIRRADQLIADHCKEPLTVEDLAEAVGVSVRCLQEGFRRYFDTTPTARLREARLSGVHADLSAADAARVTVSRLAAGWGFHHFGRFAATYKKRFGESPSETLRR